jgi:hypothetical protein
MTPHDHVTFLPESVIAARVCSGCGAYVAATRTEAHQAFHDVVAALAVGLPIAQEADTPNSTPPEQGVLFDVEV